MSIEYLGHAKAQGAKLSGTFKLALFFAFNPDEVLLTGDVAIKIGMDPGKVPEYLRHSVNAGIFSRRKVGPGGVRAKVEWSAGPALLELVGQFKPPTST